MHGAARFDAGQSLQPFRHLAVRVDVRLDYRTPTRWGSTSNTFPACKNCAVLPNSNGFWVDGRVSLISDINVRLGIDAWAEYTLGGRRNFLWPLEEISPSRGWTVGGDLSYRF